MQRICLFIDDYNSNSTLILITVAVKWCMDIGARPHVCRVCLIFLIFVLTLVDGVCCVWFIDPVLVLMSYPRRYYISRAKGENKGSVFPCGGGVEYLHRSPANHKKRRKGNPVPGGKTRPPYSWGI
jgi:hypothetical protein